MNVKSITAYDKRLKSLNQALSRFFVNSYSQIPYGIEKRGIFLISFILTKRPSFLRTEGIRRARARTSALTPFRSAGYPSGLTKKSITEIDETSSAALNPPSDTSARAYIRLEIRRFIAPLTQAVLPVFGLPQHDDIIKKGTRHPSPMPVPFFHVIFNFTRPPTRQQTSVQGI